MARYSIVFALLALACGGSSGSSGGATGGAAGSSAGGSSGVGGSGATAGSGSSAGVGGGSGGTAGASACTPSPGTEEFNASCDQVRIGVMQHPGQPARLDIRARISAGVGCVLVDEVILGDDQNAIQTIDAGGVEPGEYNERLFDVEASPDITALCADETKRIEPFGFIARGRMDGGTFTAKCGPAGFGTGWPPHVVLSCHSGIAEQPYAANSTVDALGSLTTTTLWAAFRHPPGTGSLLSTTGDVRILPYVAPFPPKPLIDAFDTTGWQPNISDSTVDGKSLSQFQAWNGNDVLGLDVCPAYDPGNPTPDPSPVYLAKVSGAASEGAFSSEIFVDICTRLQSSP